jgi:hypothetical protein
MTFMTRGNNAMTKTTWTLGERYCSRACPKRRRSSDMPGSVSGRRTRSFMVMMERR